MPRQRIVWCDYSSAPRAPPGGMPGRREGRSRENPYRRSAKFRERGLYCKGRFGEPCKGTAEEVSPPGISLQGSHWEEKIWAGLCPAGMGML